MDEFKLEVQKLRDENKLFIEESNSFKYENLRLKSELELAQKNFIETQNKLNSFIKGKEVLDNLTQLTLNKNKRGLGFEGQSSKDTKEEFFKKTIVKFVKASEQKPQVKIKQSLLYNQKESSSSKNHHTQNT